MTDFRKSLVGIVAMLLSCLFFIINDTIVKVLGQGLPVGEVLFVRSLIATAVVFAYVVRAGLVRECVTGLSGRAWGRSFAEGLATVSYLTGLMHLPIANATAIGQAAPLAVTAAGALLLGETVGWRRWTSIAVGFAGILIVVRPGPDGFNVWALLPLLSVGFVTFREIATRTMPPGTNSAAVLLATMVAVTLCCGSLSLFESWEPIPLAGWGLIVAAAVMTNLGTLGSIVSMRHGDITVVAPFRYSFIPYAAILGFVVWGDAPDLLTVFGILVVIASGLYVLHRERVRQQRLASGSERGI